MGGGQVGGVFGGGGVSQGGCEQTIEVFVKIQKNCGGRGEGGGVGLRGQGGCDRRIEVFGKIHKKKSGGSGGVRWGSGWWGGGGGGVRVDANEELKFL